MLSVLKRALYAVLFLVTVLAVLINWPLAEYTSIPSSGPTVISNVTVIDVKTGQSSANKDVFLRDGKIAQVIDYVPDQVSSELNVIDARGKFLIPGLWNMHTHSWKLSAQLHHPLHVAHGITSVRDMSGCLHKDDEFWACPSDRQRWNQEMMAAQRVSPGYVQQSSYQTNGGNEVPSSFPSFFKLSDDGDAAKLADFYLERGVESIKPYTDLSREQYFSLVKAASDRGLRIAGHRPVRISLTEAIAAGQSSIEHGRLFLFECSDVAAEFRQHPNPVSLFDADFKLNSVEQRSVESCAMLMEEMADSETWWTPTLTTLAMGTHARDDEDQNDLRLDYVPWMQKALFWNQDISQTIRRGYASNGVYANDVFFEQAKKDVAMAEQAGIKILVGTDTTDTYVFTGSSMHDEMQMMADAGLSTQRILKAATIDAAVYSGLDRE
ncbi:MAG: amidohydrolase family protein, partial [Pseudomonadota bacterium]